MKRRWTKADANRAEKMGWQCRKFAMLNEDEPSKDCFYEVVRSDVSKFKSNHYAAEHVMTWFARYWADWDDSQNAKTYRKAILICCLGGNE